jgi:RNA polymerase sigma-70 factor (ECF subfamily)
VSVEVSRCDLRQVADQIRPFVARRVPAAEVDDVVQEILLRVHREFEAADDTERFSRWLYRVAKNVIVDQHRRRTRRERKHAALAQEPDEIGAATDVDVEDDATATFVAFVATFVGTLPAPYQEALRLTELEGLTMREAAQHAGISESGMKSRVQRGRRMLRESFEACCEIALDARGRVVDYTARPLDAADEGSSAAE